MIKNNSFNHILNARYTGIRNTRRANDDSAEKERNTKQVLTSWKNLFYIYINNINNKLQYVHIFIMIQYLYFTEQE
jgi:hypothetical protein